MRHPRLPVPRRRLRQAGGGLPRSARPAVNVRPLLLQEGPEVNKFQHFNNEGNGVVILPKFFKGLTCNIHVFDLKLRNFDLNCLMVRWILPFGDESNCLIFAIKKRLLYFQAFLQVRPRDLPWTVPPLALPQVRNCFVLCAISHKIHNKN